MRTLALLLFLFITPLVFAQPLLFPVLLPSATPPAQIPNGMVLTPFSTLRGADGELVISIGNDKSLVSPPLWLMKASGEIICVTQHQGIQYQLAVRQLPLVFESAPAASRAGVFSVTATNTVQPEQTAVVWFEWRHRSRNSTRNLQGLLLDSQVSSANSVIPYDQSWIPYSTWYFQRNAFLRDNRIIYYIPNPAGWDKENWVRQDSVPYEDLLPESRIGTQRFSIQLGSGKQSSLEAWVPFQPLPLEQLSAFASFIRPAESTPADPPESQKRTQ